MKLRELKGLGKHYKEREAAGRARRRAGGRGIPMRGGPRLVQPEYEKHGFDCPAGRVWLRHRELIQYRKGRGVLRSRGTPIDCTCGAERSGP
jgi:hypothetical protein